MVPLLLTLVFQNKQGKSCPPLTSQAKRGSEEVSNGAGTKAHISLLPATALLSFAFLSADLQLHITTLIHSPGGVLQDSGPHGLYLANISNSLFSESQ